MEKLTEQRDRIEIEKDLIPYNFDIVLGGELFNMEFFYNSYGDFYTVSLYKDEEILCRNEPIVYGVELFSDIYISDSFPKLTIIPYDESGLKDTVTKDTFGETVFLVIDN